MRPAAGSRRDHAGLPPRLGVLARLRAYREIGRVQFRTILVYRVDWAIGLIGLLLQIFALRVVWTSVYAERSSVAGSGGVGQISLSVQIAYATLAALQFWLLNSWARYPIAQRIREGKIAIDLSRPVGLVPQVVAGQLGATGAMVPFALLALPFALVAGGAAAPASPIALLGYLATSAGALGVATLLTTSVSMIAFWTLENTGFWLAYRIFTQFLAGALVPLWFMPGWLRAVAQTLPFQTTTYTPIAIYLGEIEGSGIWRALALQAFWILALWLLLRVVWSRALLRVVVQGG